MDILPRYTNLPKGSTQAQRRSIAMDRKEVACTVCNETDPEKFYYTTDGHRNSMCRQCTSERRKELARQKPRENKPVKDRKKKIHPHPRPDVLKNKYGMTVQDYLDMVEKQGGCCAICKKRPIRYKNLFVDHCHKTGKIRGLLCRKCNSGLGMFNDNPSLLSKASYYLASAKYQE